MKIYILLIITLIILFCIGNYKYESFRNRRSSSRRSSSRRSSGGRNNYNRRHPGRHSGRHSGRHHPNIIYRGYPYYSNFYYPRYYNNKNNNICQRTSNSNKRCDFKLCVDGCNPSNSKCCGGNYPNSCFCEFCSNTPMCNINSYYK